MIGDVNSFLGLAFVACDIMGGMNKSRLEAFSDGLFAVVITIMVLELQAPRDVSFWALGPLVPIFLSYVLSFVYGAIFWVNHHHLLAATQRVSTPVLWANLNFLFWLSLIPFFTAWVDENHVAAVPVAAYGAVLFAVFASYILLEQVLFRAHDANAPVVKILRSGRREKITLVTILLGVALSFAHPFVALGMYIAVAIIWVQPDKRLEKAITDK